MSTAVISNENPAARNSSARRGDEEASTSRMVRSESYSGLFMRPLSHVIPSALLHLLRDAPLSNGKVGFAWRTSVGPAMERATAVRLEGTRLLVDASSAQWAREVKRASPIILKRLQEMLGAETVERIEVRRA